MALSDAAKRDERRRTTKFVGLGYHKHKYFDPDQWADYQSNRMLVANYRHRKLQGARRSTCVWECYA